MKRLLTAAALALLSTTAHAATSKPMTLFKGGYWETYAMTANNDGVPMCGMQADFSGNAMMFLKWTPTNGMAVQVSRSHWRLAEGTKVPLQLEFFDNAKPGDSDTVTADAGIALSTKGAPGMSVFMTINKEDMGEFLKVFGAADKLTISFPQGDEPTWTTKMDGSRKAANEFMHCMYIVQQTIKSAQPTSPVKPTQPVKPTETQPVKPATKRDDGSV